MLACPRRVVRREPVRRRAALILHRVTGPGHAVSDWLLIGHSIPVHPYTLAATSSLAWPLVPPWLNLSVSRSQVVITARGFMDNDKTSVKTGQDAASSREEDAASVHRYSMRRKG